MLFFGGGGGCCGWYGWGWVETSGGSGRTPRLQGDFYTQPNEKRFTTWRGGIKKMASPSLPDRALSHAWKNFPLTGFVNSFG